MKIDYRMLFAVVCVLVAAAAAVVIVRYPRSEDTAAPVEIIAPKGAPTTARTSAGLQLKVSAKGLSLSFPACATAPFQDKFFLHLYVNALAATESGKFVNLDFDLAQEKGKESVSNGSKSCVYYKSFADFPVKQVIVGQFTTPQGRCCDIIWSRSFVFDQSFLSGR